jgi:thiol-disulfide isomerase/thioredoxin
MRPLLIAFILVLAGCHKQAPQPEQTAQLSGEGAGAPDAGDEAVPAPRLDRSRAGSTAPAEEFEDPDGEPVSFERFAGKPLLVNFWATWCAPCVGEMPTLDALAGRGAGRLQVLAVSQDMDGRQKVDAFFARHRFRTIEAYLDSKMALSGALKLETLPTTILYDARGREVWRVVGMEDWRGARAAKLIDEAFKPGKAQDPSRNVSRAAIR